MLLHHHQITKETPRQADPPQNTYSHPKLKETCTQNPNIRHPHQQSLLHCPTPPTQSKNPKHYYAPNFKKRLVYFPSGKQAYTDYDGKPSTTRHITSGVPQGSVFSPTLINLFMNDISFPSDPHRHLMSYPDDVTIFLLHKMPTVSVFAVVYLCCT